LAEEVEVFGAVLDVVVKGAVEGTELLRRNRCHDRSSSTPFFALSGLAQQLFQESSAQSKFLAVNAFGFKGPLLIFCLDWGIWDANRRNRLVPPRRQGTLKLSSEKVGDWNRIEILVIENRFRFVNNGELVFDFTDDAAMLRPCPTGLQLHKNEKPQEFQFRGPVLTGSPGDLLVTPP
jgi:hypothetical protein